jgi:hypothetical protein
MVCKPRVREVLVRQGLEYEIFDRVKGSDVNWVPWANRSMHMFILSAACRGKRLKEIEHGLGA